MVFNLAHSQVMTHLCCNFRTLFFVSLAFSCARLAVCRGDVLFLEYTIVVCTKRGEIGYIFGGELKSTSTEIFKVY
jgi:hypothetical protein